jgi:hypothetical protein
MTLKHSLSSSLVLTLVTGKHDFSITAGDELMEESDVNILFNNHLITLSNR